MEKINRLLLKYLIYVLPLMLIYFIIALTPALTALFKNIPHISLASDIMGWVFISWLAVLIIVLVQLLFSQDMRSMFFSAAARLAGVKERDERESQAIDKAGRYAFISTLSLMVCLLFFYSVNVQVGNLPPEKWMDGKHKTLTVGFGIALTDVKQEAKPEDKYKIFSNWDLPISKWSLIAIMIAWHLISFLFYLRRVNKYS